MTKMFPRQKAEAVSKPFDKISFVLDRFAQRISKLDLHHQVYLTALLTRMLTINVSIPSLIDGR